MTEAVLCLGSNVIDGEANITGATAVIAERIGDITSRSGVYPSSGGYLNMVVSVETQYQPEEIVIRLKDIERQFGRTPEMKIQGIVPLDIDLVIYDRHVIREFDYRQKYFRMGYENVKKTVEL